MIMSGWQINATMRIRYQTLTFYGTQAAVPEKILTKMARKNNKLTAEEQTLRIVGGHFRGSKLRYHGDPTVRPMKHRVRESIFNLISVESAGKHAIDLFAGTGALGLEAISRGATSATFIERHVPTSRIVQENIASLGLEDRTTLLTTSAFLWGVRDLPNLRSDIELRSKTELPWLVFCSPPYAFFIDREADMLALIAQVTDHAPPGSILLVEADERFDFAKLPGEWDVRTYAPAIVGLRRLGG